jgi:H+/Cl- antiporter ClcA
MTSRASDQQPKRSWKLLAFGVLIGAIVGLTAAVALAVLPDLLRGNDLYEYTDPMLVYALVLGPMGAAVGLLVSAVLSARRSPSPILLSVAFTLFMVMLIGTWKIWADMTGTPGPF